MRKASRLFELIELLRRARAPLPAHAMAAALEVDKRTIYRDIAALQALRVPIEGAAGVGYVMRRGYDLPPLMFTAEEIEAVVIGLALLGRTRDEDLVRAADGVRRKVAAVLPGDRALDGLPLHASTWTATPPGGGDLGLIRAAIREEAKLRFSYADPTGRTSLRTVLPLTLTYWVDGIVLAAWCELRDDYRHFRIDRMTECRPTGDTFRNEGARLRAALVDRSSDGASPDGLSAA